MGAQITGSMLYDLVHCPHRVTMDLFGDTSKRDEVNPFIQLLWERGNAFERNVIRALEIPYVDLSRYAGDEKERLTEEAIRRGEPLIYSGRIQSDDLLGDPDLLRREGDGYVPGDIKSGAGEVGSEDDGRPKKHYAMQLALYVDILERKGLSAGRRGFIWDVNGREVTYDLAAPQGVRNPRTLWDEYQVYLATSREIIARSEKTLPAYGGTCKLCHWYSACLDELQSTNDLTLIPELGRSKRDAMVEHVQTIHEFAASEPSRFIAGRKTVFPGIGVGTLGKLHQRACLLVDPDGTPYLKEPVELPPSALEIFFDIEVDPMRDICYLHGFVERREGDNDRERYVAFFTDTPTPVEEERAFAEAWQYLQEAGQCSVYYYSKYERTIWRKLREKYPGVCTEEELEQFFDPGNAVDLYFDVVLPKTEWPTKDYSIKTLAKYLGFSWRDTHPSGAASIEWFHRWVDSGDLEIKQRILDYNEDDCRATRVLLDGIRALPVRG